MATTSSSPLCTWLVAAACMSIDDSDNKQHSPPHLKPSLFHSSKRFTSWAAAAASTRRRRTTTTTAVGVGRDFPRGGGFMSSSSSLCGGSSSSSTSTSIQGLMSSCLAFEPSQEEEYYNNGFSLFGRGGGGGGGGGGSKTTTTTTTMMTSRQRRRMMNSPLVHAGETMSVDAQPSEEASIRDRPLTKQRRVVVTGMGVVSSVGHDPDVFYNNLLEGVSGITEIESFDCSNYPTRIAGEIKSLSTEGWVAPKLARRVDKFMTYMLTAGKKALADAGISEDVMAELDKSRCGVLIGSGMGGMQVFHDAVEALRISVRKVNPFCIPFATTNMGSAILAMDLGWMGPNYSISTACATSNFCILNAANHIIGGEADVMLCGGSDAVISPLGMGGFVACRALSQRNDDPTKASRPWDTNRDGFVMGEGAGVLLLEELEHAKVTLNFINDSEKRGAHIYAEFLGGSFTCDAYHMTEPHPNGRGVILCIENALAQSGVAREDVNYVNAHATSTQAGDLKEFQSLIHCFGQNPDLRVNSTKSMIGHLLGAAGAVEAVATIQAIRTGWVHPNINLENPEEAVDTNVLVGPKKERLDIKVALSNSFGFGGHNASILFAPYK